MQPAFALFLCPSAARSIPAAIAPLTLTELCLASPPGPGTRFSSAPRYPALLTADVAVRASMSAPNAFLPYRKLEKTKQSNKTALNP